MEVKQKIQTEEKIPCIFDYFQAVDTERNNLIKSVFLPKKINLSKSIKESNQLQLNIADITEFCISLCKLSRSIFFLPTMKKKQYKRMLNSSISARRTRKKNYGSWVNYFNKPG